MCEALLYYLITIKYKENRNYILKDYREEIPLEKKP